VQDVVTLASLVERETPRPEERPHVAGVFENRLRIGQRLQCDPTVAYALMLAGLYSGKLDGERSPFRFAIQHVPEQRPAPGPIANPGEAALRAALDPPPTDDLYFVANTEGGHFFSKTLEEHNRERRALPPPARTIAESSRASLRVPQSIHEQIQSCEGAMTASGSPDEEGNDSGDRA
jgi:UPF0755 protein